MVRSNQDVCRNIITLCSQHYNKGLYVNCISSQAQVERLKRTMGVDVRPGRCRAVDNVYSMR